MKFRAFLWMAVGMPALIQAQNADYCLTVEPHAVDGVAGHTTYRFYVDAVNANDFVGGVFGDASMPFALHTSNGFYNDALGATTGDAINTAIFGTMPSAEFDSWVTIGSASIPTPPAMAVTAIESPMQPWISRFDAAAAESGSDVLMDDAIGGIWFLMPGAPNGSPDATNQRVLIMQVTVPSADDVWGTLNFQVSVGGDVTNLITRTVSYNGAGTFCPGDEVAVAEREAADWTVYPTLGDGQLVVEGWASEAELTVFDAQGRQVLQFPMNPGAGVRQLDCTALRAGGFTMVATRGEQRAAQRFFIQ